MFKVNSNDTGTMALMLFCCLCWHWTYFTPFSSVSLVDFEQVNIGWGTQIFWVCLTTRKSSPDMVKSWNLYWGEAKHFLLLSRILSGRRYIAPPSTDLYIENACQTFSCEFLVHEWGLYQANIYLFKVNNKNTIKRCEICSKLAIKTPGDITDIVLVFLLLTLNIFHTIF